MLLMDAFLVNDFLFYAIFETVIFIALVIFDTILFKLWKKQKSTIFKLNFIYFTFITLSVGFSAEMKYMWKFCMVDYSTSLWLTLLDKGFFFNMFMILANITFKFLSLRQYSQKIRWHDYILIIAGGLILTGFFMESIEEFWISAGILVHTIWAYSPSLIKSYRSFKKIHDPSREIFKNLFYYSILYNLVWVFTLADSIWDFLSNKSFGPFYYLIFVATIIALYFFYKANILPYLSINHDNISAAANFTYFTRSESRSMSSEPNAAEIAIEEKNVTEALYITCPICHRATYFHLSMKLIEKCQKSEKGITSVFIRRNITCPHSYIVFIDKKFKVRRYEILDFSTDVANLLKDLPYLLFYMREDGTILDIYGNQSIIGITADISLNQSVFEILPQKIAQKIAQNVKINVETSLNVKRSISFTESLMLNGNTRVYSIRITPSKDKNITLLIEDITDKANMENQILKNHVREEKMKSIALMAGGIAHDFNNILVSILGNVNILQLDESLSEENKEILQDLENAVMRAKDLTEQLLNFSKSDEKLIHKKEVNLHQIIHDSLSLVMRGSNCTYTVNFTPNLPLIKGDVGQLSQLFNNLLINSKQAMPSGGKIAIITETGDFSHIKNFNLENPLGKCVHISIKDEGSGIPESVRNRIFDPYFTTKRGGSGLGLATCYAIVKKHKGYITFDSEVNKGTTFHIYFPLSEELASG